MNKNNILPGNYSPEYLEWIQSPEFTKYFGEQAGLTNAQHRFAEFLLLNSDMVAQVGDMEPVFISIRSYLKHNNK